MTVKKHSNIEKESKKEEISQNTKDSHNDKTFLGIMSLLCLVGVLLLVGISSYKQYKKDADNTLEYTVNTSKPIEIEQSRAKAFDVKELIYKKEGQVVKITGDLDPNNTKVQTVNIEYSMGDNKKTDQLQIKVIPEEKWEAPTITLKSELVHIPVGAYAFNPKDMVESIKDFKGQEIAIKSNEILEKETEQHLQTAYFVSAKGEKFDINKEGKYPIHVVAYDKKGNQTISLFLINVTNDVKTITYK